MYGVMVSFVSSLCVLVLVAIIIARLSKLWKREEYFVWAGLQ
jgi:hypothetical protein